MAEAARHLRPVPAEVERRGCPECGSVLAPCPACAEAADEIAGLHVELRAWRTRYANLKRDRERDARKHRLWPAAVGLFDYWRRACRHPGSKFDASRFELILPFLDTDGEELCRRAIDGAAFDPYTTKRRNGTTCRHDGWDLIFRSRAKFEEFANRAPREVDA